MRDYSFGNFISAMRERSGLSQYQLGALVGVSDKAVSKWENGVSKPRLSKVRRLAEVFDVSVDELLTCEYDIFEEERMDLFTMKNKIFREARARMEELYGSRPPLYIRNRFESEKLILDGEQLLLWMGFLGSLQKKILEADSYFEVRDTQIGASFIAWLLGGTNINPLPAHYYCSSCKKITFIPEAKCGLDLEDSYCSCGCKLQKDGFNIDAALMTPVHRCCEIYSNPDASSIIFDTLQEYYKGYAKVKKIRLIIDEDLDDSDPGKARWMVPRYAIITKELEYRYSEEEICLTPQDFFGQMDILSPLTTGESDKELVKSSQVSAIDFSKELLREYFQYIKKNGMGYGEEELDVRTAFSDLKDVLFSDLIAIEGMLRSVGAWKNNGELRFVKGTPLRELVACREDVYEYIYEQAESVGCKNPVGVAYDLHKAIRMGKRYAGQMLEEVLMLLQECEVPEWYVECVKKIHYLPPRTMIVPMLKRQIADYVYQKVD